VNSSREPLDSQGWLQEIAQLELYTEEMQWLISEHEHRAGDIAVKVDPSHDAARKHDISVLKGEKDLRWVRQQLRMCELEHSSLLQQLNCVDPAAREMQAVELKEVESEIVAEQKRQKQLMGEKRQRERTLVANAVDGREVADANARAAQQIEKFEAELGVWKNKNGSLQKQVHEAMQQLQKAQSQHHTLGQKAQHMEKVLGSEEHAARQAEQVEAQQRFHSEVARLQQQLLEMRESRDQGLKNHHRERRENGKELAELAKVVKDLEDQERQLEPVARQLERKLRQHDVQLHLRKPSPRPDRGHGKGRAAADEVSAPVSNVLY
jgi:hypothetical protein